MSNDNYLDALKDSYQQEFKFHGENILMERWYAGRVISSIREKGLRSLISLGMGDKTLSQEIIRSLANHLDRYTIIEGSSQIIHDWLSLVDRPDFVVVENAFFEQFEPEGPVQAIEMGFVLEHVDDPELIVRRYSEFLQPGGVLYVAVPNARSLHRLIGHEAGLLDDPYALSEYDLKLGHKRYFDSDSLVQLLRDADLRIARTEGIFLKPLTQSQLVSVGLGPEVIQALLKVAVGLPAISNAIFVECVK